MSSTTDPTPPGVIALFVAPDGHVVADASCFTPRHHVKHVSHRKRSLEARHGQAADAERNLRASLVNSIRESPEKFLKMLEDAGYRIEIRLIGHPEE